MARSDTTTIAIERDAPGFGFAQLALEGLRGGVLGVDARGLLCAANSAAHQILGDRLPDPPSLGRPLEQALASALELATPLRAALAGSPPAERSELVLAARSRSESPLTIGYTASTLRAAGGPVCGAVLVFRDLVAIERRGERERVQERLAALGAMAAQLAHELRNPVAAITVQADLLRRRAVEPETLAFLAHLDRELASIEQSVERTLDSVRPVAPARRACDPIKLIEAALARASARVPFRGRVERRYPPALPRLWADPDALAGALAHVIENALEVMEGATDGELRLELRLRTGAASTQCAPSGCYPIGSELEILIRDDGPGVPAALRERIFHPFVTTKAQGSGIGLAAAHKVIASHAGSLGLVEPSLPGAAFSILLPVEDEEAPAP